MKPPWYESKGIIPWLLLILLVLLIAVLLKEGLISASILNSQKDTFDVVSKIITSIVMIVGGILSYIKFFKGRILRPKLNIIPRTGVIFLEKENLHWLDLEIQNKGSVAIWNYVVEVYATLHGDAPRSTKITEFIEIPKSRTKEEHLIDVGESSHEHAIIRVPKEIWAVTYQILISVPNGSMWDQYLTTSNMQTDYKNPIKSD